MKKTISSVKELSANVSFTLFRKLVFLCPLFLTLVSVKPFAANQITGTVLDADTKLPLKNALVSLKSTGDLVLTNENGIFSLMKTEVNTIKKSRSASIAPFKLNRNQLQLNISNPNTPVQIVILNLTGQLVYKTTKILQSGFHNFDLSKFLSTNSTYILQIKINQTNYISKILPLAVRPSGSPLVSSSSSP
ncbi:MAG TPA: T9SS type A sorting domain-containing protein, partial [Chitinispirillaceae bacterium]|nr:T9SS type A sorting domain-containing protein [Chitinispirillaceae bacterium]